jgi:DNA-binding response OmpR family regulator
MALRFLLVEPHLELRDHLGQLLTASYGAQVQVCSDYASALEHARAGNPDLIVAAVGIWGSWLRSGMIPPPSSPLWWH